MTGAITDSGAGFSVSSSKRVVIACSKFLRISKVWLSEMSPWIIMLRIMGLPRSVSRTSYPGPMQIKFTTMYAAFILLIASFD